jgi:methyl-accepting chemotaxis protein
MTPSNASSTIQAPGAPIGVDRPGAGRDRPAGGFFRYHGVWAPGVRLFRSIGFQAKAWVISLVFAVPIVLLASFYFADKAASIGFSAQERMGVRYARAALPLLPALGEVARGAADPAMALARTNAAVAERGGRIIGAMVRTMEDIQSSHRIGDMIGTIDGVAFQTNILALNAAVEAARAGDAGRGFAVVAAEVRQLAQRSAAAAREIKTLITASVDKVESGTAVVRDAGVTIEEIVAQSRRVDQLLVEIAAGAREQAAGVGQTTQAVQEMDTTTQQNAALVEQTASSATGLKEQARALAAEVARFRLSS